MNVAICGTARARRGWPPKEYKNIFNEHFNSLYWINNKDNFQIQRWVDKWSRHCTHLTKIEQVLEDKYQAMKHAKGWEEEEDDYALFASPSSKKGPRKHSKDAVDTVENLNTKQLIVPTRKATKIRARNQKLIKRKSNMAKGTPKAKDI